MRDLGQEVSFHVSDQTNFLTFSGDGGKCSIISSHLQELNSFGSNEFQQHGRQGTSASCHGPGRLKAYRLNWYVEIKSWSQVRCHEKFYYDKINTSKFINVPNLQESAIEVSKESQWSYNLLESEIKD